MAKRVDKSKGRAPTRDSESGVPEMPEGLVAELLESLSKRGAMPGIGLSAVEQLESAFEDFLDLAGPDEVEDPDEDSEAATEVFGELSESLDQLRIDSNGGDPRARKALATFRARLDKAIANDDIHPANLIILGKVLWNAGLPIGENLRKAAAQAFSGDEAMSPENAGHFATLAVVGIEKFTDPFTLYDEAASNMAAFPTKFRIALATPLASSRKGVARAAALGFALHPEEALARAVLEAFPSSSAPSAGEGAVVDRLARIAGWLSPGRREVAETALAKMRAGPRVAPAPVKIVRIIASAHDGSGADNIMACVKIGARYDSISVLMKPQGVTEVVGYPDLGRAEAERLMKLLESSSPAVDIGVDGAAGLVALALGRNISAGSSPPFRLVQFCEALGLGRVQPDPSSAAQILAKLLADTPFDGGQVSRAHAEIGDSRFVESWFEAGEPVEKLLRSTKTRTAAARKLLDDYLPTRRQFWARLCATSAYVFAHAEGGKREVWKKFALVGRDIASDVPIARIPLMVQIADGTAAAFFDRPK